MKKSKPKQNKIVTGLNEAVQYARRHKPKKPKLPPPPTPEQRLDILRAEHDALRRVYSQREAQGDFDANSMVIRETLAATLDIIAYLISLHERDKKPHHLVRLPWESK